MAKVSTRSYLVRLLIVPVLLALCALLAHLMLPERTSPVWALLLSSILVINLATIAQERWVQNTLIVTYSLLLAFTAAEGVSLVLNPMSATSLEKTDGDGLFGDQPILGWGPKRSGTVHATKIENQTKNTVYDVDYTIDENLLRKTESAQDGPTVAFFGDSFVYGDGVNNADTFPQVFADLQERKLRVLNFGFPGYGPQQFLRTIETGFRDQLLGPNLKLVVFTTFAFQAERTSCKEAYALRAPRYALDEDGWPGFAGYCAQGLTRAVMEFVMHSVFYQRYFEAKVKTIREADIDLYLATVLRAAALTKEKYGVPVLIVYDRVSEDFLHTSGFTNDDLISRFRNEGIQVLEMDISKEVPADAVIAFPNDGHPTPIAQHARAAVLKRYLDEHMPNLTAMANIH